MFILIILWVRTEPSWMSYSLHFEYVLSVSMVIDIIDS